MEKFIKFSKVSLSLYIKNFLKCRGASPPYPPFWIVYVEFDLYPTIPYQPFNVVARPYKFYCFLLINMLSMKKGYIFMKFFSKNWLQNINFLLENLVLNFKISRASGGSAPRTPRLCFTIFYYEPLPPETISLAKLLVLSISIRSKLLDTKFLKARFYLIACFGCLLLLQNGKL